MDHHAGAVGPFVVPLAANNDSEIGRMIAEAMQKVGNEGVITVEEAKSLGTELEARRTPARTKLRAHCQWQQQPPQPRCWVAHRSDPR